MSRDWTPREQLAAEKFAISQGRGDYFDFLRNSAWHIDGKVIPLCSEEEIALRKNYPFLGKLYEDFKELHTALSAIAGGLELLADHEKKLAAYIEQGTGDRESFLIRWFEGELDTGFYYRERNNELLMECMIDEAKSLDRSKLPTPEPLSEKLNSAVARSQESSANTAKTPNHKER